MKLLSVIALALLATGSARADDAIKAGKWEYTALVQMPNMPNMPKLPPGVQLPPNLQMGPNGMKVTNTRCITPDEAAPDGRPPGQNSKYTRDKWERDGGTVHWAMTCQTQHGPAHMEGVGHYHGDTMEADITTQTSPSGGPPQTITTHVTGQYLGACDAK